MRTQSNLIKDIAAAACGFKKNLESGLCPTCGKKPDLSRLRDARSREEYMISRMCMECQDRVFGADE